MTAPSGGRVGGEALDYVIAGLGWTVPAGHLSAGTCRVLRRETLPGLDLALVLVEDEATGATRLVAAPEIRLTPRADAGESVDKSS